MNQSSFVAVYAGRKLWEGGTVPHQSFFWFGIKDSFDPKEGRQLRRELGLYWWAQDQPFSPSPLDGKSTPRPANVGDGPQFVRMTIDVRDDSIAGRIGGIDFPPLAATDMLGRLKLRSVQRTEPIGYTFGPPAFGPGIGVYLSNADGIVANLTVSRPNP